MDHRGLERTLLALRGVARAAPPDALLENVDRFLAELALTGLSEPALQALATSIDAWLAQRVGPLLGRVSTLLSRSDSDVGAVCEVLRALWVVLGGAAPAARFELAQIGL